MFACFKAVAGVGILACLLAAPAHGQTSLDGRPVRVIAERGEAVTVVFFLRSDCPVSNLYAPEIARLAKSFAGSDVRFWLEYPDRSDSGANVRQNLDDFYAGTGLVPQALRDPEHVLVREARVDMMPEAAVFRGRQLWYSGRIDDRVAGLGQYRASAAVHDVEDAIHAAIAGKPAHAAGGPAYGCYIADAQ